MIITTLQLWKDYDRLALELNTSVISSASKEAYKIKYVYFNGDSGTRIFAKLFEPNEPTGNAVMVMDDITNTVDAFDASAFLALGYAVLVVDYAGEHPVSPRYTIYPAKLGFANYYLNPSCITQIPVSFDSSCRFEWAKVALRAYTFLEKQGFKKIAALGVGDGITQIIKLAALEGSLTAAAIKFSGTFIPQPEGEPDNLYIAYRAALDAVSYMPNLKAPLFVQVTSNEQNSSLDQMNTLCDAAESDKVLFSISQRSDRVINMEQSRNIERFFSAKFEELPVIKSPRLTARGSEKSLYCGLIVDESEEIENVKLYYAQAQRKSAYRNWQKSNVEKTGPGEYISKLTVYNADEPVYAFANVKYKNGLCVSTLVISIKPSSLGVTAAAVTQKRFIYGTDMGAGDWLMLGDVSESDSISVLPGPFDIDGISSSTFHLATFILADSRYKGDDDSLLQLNLYSSVNQYIKFSLTSTSGAVYVCRKALSPQDNWTKITLAPKDFRSVDSVLSSWQNVIMFEVSGADSFLINTVLWV